MSDLQRFLDAQQPVIEAVLAELRQGRKRTHWMWFVFPQLAGLGHSDMARLYAIRDLEEARRYAAHPILGARLEQCAAIVSATCGKTAHDIFGSPDDLKLHSCMTLFAIAAPERPVFERTLNRFFAGTPDARTLKLLGRSSL
jgi:uncharacterized protein (DUF1810 family)